MITTQFYGVDKRPGASAYFGGMQDNGTWFSTLDPDALDAVDLRHRRRRLRDLVALRRPDAR